MGELITLAGAGANQMSVYEELYREYLEDRVLVINDEIHDGSIEDYVLYILKWNKEDLNLPSENRKPITIYISSPGGSVFNANILADVIIQSKTPVVGVGLDLVASAAYIVFLACHKRYAFMNTSFLQHEGELAIENSRSKFKQTANYFEESEVRSKQFILSRTNMTEEFYDSVYDQELWMHSEKAKELGIIDKIIGVDCGIDEVFTGE